MTINVEKYIVRAPGDGSNFRFPFGGMKVYDATELLVLKVTNATGAVETVTAGTGASNYKATFSSPLTTLTPADGYITYPADESTAITSAYTIVIARIPPLTQTHTLTNLGASFPGRAELALDRLMTQMQYLQEQLDRTIKAPQQTPDSVSLEAPRPRAGYSWRWNDEADTLEEVIIGPSADVVTSFLDLGDTPASYSGAGGQGVVANAGGTALEFEDLFDTFGATREFWVGGHAVDNASDAGAGSNGTWATRPITEEFHNSITGASLASNVVTLPAGTYIVRANGTYFRCDRCQQRLRDTGNSVTLVIGLSCHSASSGSIGFVDAIAMLQGVFTLAAATTVELQYFKTGSTAGSQTLGRNNTNAVGDIVHAWLCFERIG